MSALGVCGDMKLLSAITAATLNATVVKKPKTFCNRTRAECMIVRLKSRQRQENKDSVAARESIGSYQNGPRVWRAVCLAVLTRIWSSRGGRSLAQPYGDRVLAYPGLRTWRGQVIEVWSQLQGVNVTIKRCSSVYTN